MRACLCSCIVVHAAGTPPSCLGLSFGTALVLWLSESDTTCRLGPVQLSMVKQPVSFARMRTGLAGPRHHVLRFPVQSWALPEQVDGMMQAWLRAVRLLSSKTIWSFTRCRSSESASNPRTFLQGPVIAWP